MSLQIKAAEEEATGKLPNRGKGGPRSPHLRRNVAFWCLVGPLVLGLLIFVYIPILWGLLLSFSQAQGTVFPTSFVWFENYRSMLLDPEFQQSLKTFVLFALFIVPVTFALALGLAVLVNAATFLRGFFRSIFFLPTAVSYVAAAIIWRLSLFNGLPFGLVNMVLGHFGIAPISWLSTVNPPWYWLVLVSVRLWLQLGFYMIIFLAGLQEIPQSIYEAASVDGAPSGWKRFRYITFPLLRNTSVSVLLLLLIAAFQAFDEFFNLLNSSGIIDARTPLWYLYIVGFGNQDFGRGDAGSFILTAIIVLFTLIQGRLFGFGRSDD
ncbi:carbohydrate ABC transporter permease [Ktedonospora formicarum]|uniref:Sugar ABC transporter permease n=1 Tax=Ktedonospora formicarum TaxID=2778364 RepID=A0A8J3HZL2_9CHLR|nr:sugar ABC transporter permease [Ktedonospora formicarum]GHO46086.1 sugar ABC transporter permease [Ktedonospora formicarum]